MKPNRPIILRRRLLGAAAALPLVGASRAQTLPLTPECRGKAELTPRQTAGPFYTPETPRRTSLVEPGGRGERLVLGGLVLSAQCRPVASALLDFWHCDETGEYDNTGYRYRGHLFADAEGRFRLETIMPGEYPGRTRHIHVKVQAPGRRVLTTQLYFPGDPGNARDFGYRPELALRIERREGVRLAVFQFVIDA
jgi:protocatechuate 3,4-dioxygenase beta subunit